MKREILCSPCGKPLRTGILHHNPTEEGRKVPGFARTDFLCDLCGAELPAGALVYAATIWVHDRGIPYHPWEHDYIDGPVGQRELDAHERLDSK